MATVTRVNGDANGVVNMDIGLAGIASNAKIIALGLTKHPTAFRIDANVSLVTAMGAGGAVEEILRKVGVASTVVMYQVDADIVSVLVEATGYDDANLAAALNTITSNVGGTLVAPFTVSSVAGFKLSL
jgi:hypothetical protein